MVQTAHTVHKNTEKAPFYLYSDEAQHVAAKHHYRPTNKAILDEYKEFDQNVNLITIEHFGGWENAQKTHFSEYGIFDQIYEKN